MMVSVGRKTIDFLAEKQHSEKCSSSRNHDKAMEFLERRSVHRCGRAFSVLFLLFSVRNTIT